ncbi:MAG: type II toxin-antitoxin system YafQ family toxin [Lachnospiraceae bacterium]|nr:type II toxin-antitoxin system YafQ family toxin [Lachnospiraceae bacterium]
MVQWHYRSHGCAIWRHYRFVLTICPRNRLIRVLSLLAEGNPLPAQYKAHSLTGNLQDFRESHIEPDWRLMYQLHEDTLILSATATSTHSDLSGK